MPSAFKVIHGDNGFVVAVARAASVRAQPPAIDQVRNSRLSIWPMLRSTNGDGNVMSSTPLAQRHTVERLVWEPRFAETAAYLEAASVCFGAVNWASGTTAAALRQPPRRQPATGPNRVESTPPNLPVRPSFCRGWQHTNDLQSRDGHYKVRRYRFQRDHE